jgi:parallel beta-helix repeat protein
LRGNRAEGNGTAGEPDDNFGFVISAGSNANLLQGNVAIGNTGDGFALATSQFNMLQGNVARQNGENGFVLFSGTSNTFKANTALENGGNGFAVIGEEGEGTSSNSFESNSALKNDGYGFFVDEALADDHLFEHNHCLLNGLGGSNIDDIC